MQPRHRHFSESGGAGDGFLGGLPSQVLPVGGGHSFGRELAGSPIHLLGYWPLQVSPQTANRLVCHAPPHVLYVSVLR